MDTKPDPIPSAHHDQAEGRGPATLVSDALDHVSSLVRNEVDLARAEMNENIKRAGAAVGVLVGALIIALTALNVLTAALVAGLVELGMDNGLAALLVGVSFAVIAFVMAKKALDELKASSLAPTRTAKNVQRDAEAVKEVYDGK